jgi:RHS repeat-associated protein
MIDHYPSDTDAPAWTINSTTPSDWTRYVPGISGDLIASHGPWGHTIHLTNLHGDLIATTNYTATGILATSEATEFGEPRSGTTPRYTWLGAKRRSAATSRGAMIMGVRAYVPQIGRFLQTDPVSGGSSNAYDYAGQDPIDSFDLDGRCRRIGWGPLTVPLGAGCREGPWREYSRRMVFRAETAVADAYRRNQATLASAACGVNIQRLIYLGGTRNPVAIVSTIWNCGRLIYYGFKSDWRTEASTGGRQRYD